MGFNVAVQGAWQALGNAVKPLATAFLRLVVFAFPAAYLFTLSDNVLNLVWWTFPISEILTCVVSAIFLKQSLDKIMQIPEPTGIRKARHEKATA